jgi:hypothetical protein
MKKSLFAALVLVICGSRAAAESDRWWSIVAYLAGDRMQGRQTGKEHREATNYVAEQFKLTARLPP